MNKIPFTLSLLLLSALNAWAAPADFSGMWETQTGTASFEPEASDSFKFSACEVRAHLSSDLPRLDITRLALRCIDENGLEFEHSLPPQFFTISNDGALYDSTGWTGRIVGDEMSFRYSDEWDGIHYVQLSLLEGGLILDWRYQGAVTPSFVAKSGEQPMKRVR